MSSASMEVSKFSKKYNVCKNWTQKAKVNFQNLNEKTKYVFLFNLSI